MSYEIVYDRQFVKAEKNGEEVFFPMFYMGSNNCYEWHNGRERRARSWGLWTYYAKGKRYATKEVLLKNIDAYRDEVISQNQKRNKEYRKENKESWIDEYNDNRWGYFTSINCNKRNFSFKSFRNLFALGCDKALTVEQLREHGICLSFHFYIYEDEEKKHFEENWKGEQNYYPQTSKELIEMIDDVEEKIKDFPYASIHFDFSGSENTFKWMRKAKFPRTKKEKSPKTFDKYYVVKDTETGNYVYRASKYGYKYSAYGRSHCKRFVKENEAKRFAEKMNNKMFRTFVVETVNEEISVSV